MRVLLCLICLQAPYANGVLRGGYGGIDTLRSGKVDDVSVLLEHVDLLDGLNGLDVHLLEGSLELLVVGARGLVDLLDLAAGSTLSTIRCQYACSSN